MLPSSTSGRLKVSLVVEAIELRQIVKQTLRAVIRICLDFSVQIMIRMRGQC
jgi:hypothetical protein